MSTFQQDVFGLTVLQNNHPDIRKLRKQTGTPAIHGNKFWKSTYLLMDYLKESPPKKGVKVLELGCGWGLAGIFCAKKFDAKVTSLDADPLVFPYLHHHAYINGIEVRSWQQRYENVTKKHLEAFDLVIAADICFWDEMAKPLFNLVRRAQQVGGTRVVMTDPGRDPFREMATQCAKSLGATYDNWFCLPPYKATGLVMDVNF